MDETSVVSVLTVCSQPVLVGRAPWPAPRAVTGASGPLEPPAGGGQGGGPRPRPREAWGPAGPSLIEGLSSQLPQRRRFVPGDSALFSRVAGFPRHSGLCGVARPSSAFWSRPATVALCTFISVLTDGGVSGGKGPGQGRGPRRTGGGVACGPLAVGAANGRSSSAIRSHLSFVL